MWSVTASGLFFLRIWRKLTPTLRTQRQCSVVYAMLWLKTVLDAGD
jgi:hypothetical protein